MNWIVKQVAAPGAVSTPEQDGLVEAVCAATDVARGLEGLARIASDAALSDVAQRARSWEIRLAAAQRVSDSDVLARIVEVTRHRDKRVYQHCADLLRARRRTLAHAMRAAELAAAYRSLLATDPDRQHLPVERFEELEAELGRLRQETGDVPQECLDVAAAARERASAEAQGLRELGTDAAEAEALCARLAKQALPTDVAACRTRLEAFEARLSQRPAWMTDHPTAAALSHSIEKAHAILAASAESAVSIEPVERAVESQSHIPGEGNGAPRAAQTENPKPAAREAQTLTPEVRDTLRQWLDRLAEALQAGKLADAQESERQINALVGTHSLPEGLARRLRRDRAQLGRMRDWARWGEDQAREQLIRSAEALVQEVPDAEALSASVPALRAEWKRLDATRPAGKSQWERFDALLVKAFQPVLELRAKRAAEEKAAAKAKAALLGECEAWLAGIDWAQAGWRALAARRQEIGGKWRSTGFAGFRDERQLRKRLDRIFKALDERLGGARDAERARREALIAEAEALRETPNLGEAIKSVVALQARWKDAAGRAQLARQDEQALWQRFRAACDAVFARRDAQRAERDAQRTRQASEREAQLTRFEAALGASDAGAIARAQAELRRSWGGAQRNARDRNDPLEPRARELLRQAERRIDTLRLEAKRGRYDALARRASLVERLENAACDGGLPEPLAAEIEQAWAGLPPLAAADEKAMRARHSAAPKASAASLDQGRAERDSLLLDLELALELPSPASASGARRERQLLRLRDRFRPGSAPAADPEALALRWYATPAHSVPEQETRMAAIVEALAKRSR